MKRLLYCCVIAIVCVGAYTVRAENASSTATTTVTHSADKSRPAVNMTCIQTAIDKRDSAILDAFDLYHDEIVAVIKVRTVALTEAWSLSDRKARKEALKIAWYEYKTNHMKAVNTWRTTKRSAWNLFYSGRRLCGPAALTEDTTSHSIDSQI